MGSRAAQRVAEPDELPELWKAEQVAAWLGISRKEVYNMVERGQLPEATIVRVTPRRLRFDVASLKTWVTEKRGSSREQP